MRQVTFLFRALPTHWPRCIQSPVPRRVRHGFCTVHMGSHSAASIQSNHKENESDNEMMSVELLLCARHSQSAQRVYVLPTDAVTNDSDSGAYSSTQVLFYHPAQGLKSDT